MAQCSTIQKITGQLNQWIGHRRSLPEGRASPTATLEAGVVSSLSAVATAEHLNYLTFKVQGRDASALRSQLGKALPVFQVSIKCFWAHLAFFDHQYNQLGGSIKKLTFQNRDIQKSKKINQIILEDLKRRDKNEWFPLSLTSHIQNQTCLNYIFTYILIRYNWT